MSVRNVFSDVRTCRKMGKVVEGDLEYTGGQGRRLGGDRDLLMPHTILCVGVMVKAGGEALGTRMGESEMLDSTFLCETPRI